MNKFIKVISATVCAAVLAACVMCSSGCKTIVSTDSSGVVTTNQVVNAQAITPILGAVVPVGVQVAIAKDPNSIAYFKAASVVLDTLVASGQYNPTNVASALSALKVSNQEAQLAVNAGLIIYQQFAGQAVAAKLQAKDILPVLQALSDAIKQGVAFSSPSSAVGVSAPAGRTITVKVN